MYTENITSPVWGSNPDRHACQVAVLTTTLSRLSFRSMYVHGSDRELIVPDFILHVVERLGHEVDLLEVLVIVGLDSGHVGVEGQYLRLVGHGVLELPVGRQETGPVGPQLAALTAQPELDREPIQLKHSNSFWQKETFKRMWHLLRCSVSCFYQISEAAPIILFQYTVMLFPKLESTEESVLCL